MNREALDAWFAQADDVLTDWNGGTDAMHSEPSKGEQEPARAESYYEQITIQRHGSEERGVVTGYVRMRNRTVPALVTESPPRAPRWNVEMQRDDGTWMAIGHIESQAFVALDPAVFVDPVLGELR